MDAQVPMQPPGWLDYAPATRRRRRPSIDVNFDQPSVGTPPGSAAEVVALGLPTPQGLYLFGSAGATHSELTSNGAPDLIDDGNGIRAQDANGLWDLSTMIAVKAFESGSTTVVVESAEAVFANLGASGSGKAISVAMLVRGHVTATTGLLARKVAAGPLTGWFSQISLSSGFPGVWAYSTAANKNSTISINHADGAHHWLVFKITRLGDTMQLWSDLGVGAEQDISSVGDLDNAGAFGWGAKGGVQASLISGQFACMLVWTDANAELIDSTAPVKLMNIAQVPAQIDTYTRASAAVDCIGYESGLGYLYGTYGDGQFDHGYADAFSHTTKLGARSNRAVTNLIAAGDPNDIAGAWTKTNVTVSAAAADLADDPTGMRLAHKITCDVDNGFVHYVITTVAATAYGHAISIRRREGATVTGRIVIYDATGAAELSSTPFSLTDDEWTHHLDHSFEWTTNAGQVSTQIRVELDTAGDAISIYGATPVVGMSTVIVDGVRVKEVIELDNVGQRYFAPRAGDIQITVVLDAVPLGSTLSVLGLCQTNTSAHDRRALWVDTSSRLVCRAEDDTGTVLLASAAGSPDPTIEQTYRARWAADKTLRGSMNYIEGIVGGVVNTSYSVGAFGHDDVDAIDGIKIGDGPNAAGHEANGLISRFTIYREDQEL